MATQIEVCNAALLELGEPELLTALDDSNRNARALLARWDLSRRAVLEARPWNFARVRIQLAANPTPPLFGPGAQYPVPNNFIRFVWHRDDPDQDYRLEGGVIVSDDGPPLEIVYIADVAVDVFSPLAADALAAHLASRIGFTVTGDKGARDTMEKLFQDRLAKAALAGAFNDEAIALDADVWLRSRQQGF